MIWIFGGKVGGGFEKVVVLDCYLCLLTTSFFASCRQMLLLVPGGDVSALLRSL